MPERDAASREIRSPLEWDAPELNDGRRRLSLEWLEADGLGGFASGTAGGARTRPDHGWYAPAVAPPARGRVLVAGCEEYVWSQGESARLSAGGTPDDGSLARFSLDPFPTWRHESRRFCLERSLCLVRNRPIAIARYSNRGAETLGLWVRPLLRLPAGPPSDAAELSSAVKAQGEVFRVGPVAGLPRLFLRGRGGQARRTPFWRGPVVIPPADPSERLWAPVVWDWTLPPEATAFLLLSLEPVATDPAQIVEAEHRRRGIFVATADPLFDELARRAEVFLLDGDSRDGAIVASYPDSADRARDSMIALPGLALATGRYATAARVLGAAAARRREGLLASRSAREARAAEFDSSDAPLWFILAAEWFSRQRRNPPRPSPLLGAVRSIHASYREGTRFGIGLSPDGLVSASCPGRALTWMNASAAGTPVTPRSGFPVEVNALWHASLTAAARLERLADETARARDLEAEAWRVARRFNEVFWCPEKDFLYDVVGPGGPDPTLRPNQIFAVSLTPDLLPPHRARAVYWAVRSRLLTPFGLRTLDPRHPAYRATYAGTPRERALAAHQGAVWPWLMGAFADAHLRLFGDSAESCRAIAAWLEPLKAHIREAGVGSISEVFDGDEPHQPRGCPASARGVAEISRVLYTYLKTTP